MVIVVCKCAYSSNPFVTTLVPPNICTATPTPRNRCQKTDQDLLKNGSNPFKKSVNTF